MDLEYDEKFEEMKKYIPFLESMIKRLESTNNGNDNPRKAQLDKIRSLRDLLLDKKKRMKMENLLKCEQVLVNLYAKVEQRDSLADKKNVTEQNTKAKNDLSVVRNKLKSVVSKLNDDPGTLPEIARATKTEVDCVPGSKEPALFQRRPNKASPARESSNKLTDDSASASKRNYTRILLSPEPKKKEWPKPEESNSEKPLFSRRSPRRSPRRYSPSYKKERKKSSKQRSKSRQQTKDLNITLKVPEESLSSLNTKDILSRIINCSDNDVDIATLRGLRSQILGELKQTGANDDISDLILKSYKKKDKISKKKVEVEEGEISDSESEAIENIYGSLVVMNKDESASTSKVTNDNQPRKIQICLVINSDKENETKSADLTLNPAVDVTDFETYADKGCVKKSTVNLDTEHVEKKKEQDKSKPELEKPIKQQANKSESSIVMDEAKKTTVDKSNVESDKSTELVDMLESSPEKEKRKSQTKEDTYKPNFYQPLTEEKSKTDELEAKNNTRNPSGEDVGQKSDSVTKIIEMAKNMKSAKPKKEGKNDSVSEIDILQALKNEILGESIGSPSSEAVTPPLHQPKITKVASAQEISNKKRISIENYKQKSIPSVKQSIFISEKSHSTPKDDGSKKKILKLTEKECERFNFPSTIAAADSSDEADDSNVSLDDVYGNLAPRSPDHDDFADTGIKPPVIIPSDPIKNLILTKSDIDMRTFTPTGPFEARGKGMQSALNSNDNSLEQLNKNKESPRNPNSENVLRTEFNQTVVNDSSNLHLRNAEKPTRTDVIYPNIPPNLSPSVTPNIPPLMSLNVLSPSPHSANLSPILAPVLNSSMSINLNASMQSVMNPNMTPSRAAAMIPSMTPIMTPNSRSYEMTPRPNFDDDYAAKKHVYAPMFQSFESDNDMNKKQSILWEKKDNIKWEDSDFRKSGSQRDTDYQRHRNDRFPYNRRDSPQIRMDCPGTPNTSFGGMDCPPTPNPSFGRMECPATPNPSFGRMDCPPTPNPSFGRMDCSSTPNPSFGRMECPSTPNPSFGRMDCPSTPNPSFGRMECPSTPNPSFGRMDCPSTPNPSFGRMDCPSTPNPSFGRLESPMTPVHPFGRSDGQMVSNHPYGRSDSNAFGRGDYNPRSNQNYNKSQDPRLSRNSDYDNYQNRNEYRGRPYYNDNQMSDTKYRRDREKYYDQDSRGDRERMSRRDTVEGRSGPRDYDNDRAYKKDYYNKDYRYGSEISKGYDDFNRRRNQRARSISRMNSSERNFSPRESRGSRPACREGSTEKLISVQSHSGRSFDIDTSLNRTFQDADSLSQNMSFNARRQRAASVGRSLPTCAQESKNQIISKNIPMQHEIPERTRAMNFRRACSVGRELKDYNASRNFKDIKADLRSSTFEIIDKKIRDRDDRRKDPRIQKTNELSGRCDQRNRPRESDVSVIKKDDGSKYSPTKNYRDPRVRREMKVDNSKDIKYADRSRSSSSSRNKNHGIVYSNDNIAKGTILASAAGVRNFKIPKIKRPVEEMTEEASQVSENNTAKEISTKIQRKPDVVDTAKNNNLENKGKKSVSSPTIKRDKMEITKDDSLEKEKFKKQSTAPLIKNNDKEESQEDDMDMVNSALENCDRRVTRSAKKDPNKQKSLIESPVKKLRRIKKPLVYDSDSDSENKNLEKQDQEKDNLLEKEMHIETNKTIKPKNHVNNNSGQTAEPVSNNQTVKPFDLESFESETRKVGMVDSENKSTSASQNELSEDHTDSLDINFSVDEEMFADNMATSSVLDNINALIADLDNDIEAPKINDFNDKFIKNIVGSISSNDSPIPSEVNETELVSDTVNIEKQTLDDAIPSGKADFSNTNIEKVEKIINDDSKCENSNKNIADLSDSNIKVDVKEREIEEKIKSNTEDKTTEHSETSNTHLISCKVASSVSEIQSNLNNDATVSTTDTEGKVGEVLKGTNLSTNTTEIISESFDPDSTNNLNDTTNVRKDLQGSFPDSTNEVTDLNNDISSTHVSADTCSKELCAASSSSSDNLPRLDSIGKLLSMLEDKNKIKELLSYLGKDSSENEKLKKKLEKLSKIVSDDEDEDTTIVAKEDTKNDNFVITEDQKNKSNPSNIATIESLDKTESNVETKEIVGKSDEHKDQSNNVLKNNTEQLLIADKELKTKENETASNDPIDTNEEEEMKENNQVSLQHDSQKNKELINNDEEITSEKDSSETTNKNEETNQETEENVQEIIAAPTKKNVRKSKITKRGRSRLAKQAAKNKEKRVTRAEDVTAQPQPIPAPKKPSRELLKLQEDIREMFISEDILNATGIRMCRLAKMVDDKSAKTDEPEPVVLLEKIKGTDIAEDSSCLAEKANTKKNKVKSGSEPVVDSKIKEKPKYKPGPKSKTKKDEGDPYAFETDSIGESSLTVDSRDQDSDSDSASINSNKSESSELLVELKKKIKRKRRGNWQLGVIRPKSSKRKRSNKQEEAKSEEFPLPPEPVETETEEGEKETSPTNVSDVSCFTDKTYCFQKNVTTYSCRLCNYSGDGIVLHYKKQHPHSEIPLSRLNPTVAKLAIEQCVKMNLQAVSKLRTSEYVCRFCFKVFNKNKESALEAFFWHVVSAHTGEYKQLCFECVNVTRCPFNLDIPPPPKYRHGQLIGYICGRCNFTQVSLENLKTHVIVRHDDEQTEVYSINLAEIPKKQLVSFLLSENKNNKTPRTLRSTRSNQSLTDRSDDLSDVASSSECLSGADTSQEKSSVKKTNLSAPKAVPKKKIKSKFVFETDDNLSDVSSISKNDENIKAAIKLERDEDSQDSHLDDTLEPTPEAPVKAIKGEKANEAAEPEAAESNTTQVNTSEVNVPENNSTNTILSNDVLDYPHFKIKFTGTGTKEYICCINRHENHYKTPLLISLKRHVQTKHSEVWDGYCFVCKVIVTSQGTYKFKDCLQHFLDKHMDNFPVLENVPEPDPKDDSNKETQPQDPPAPKSYINVRPLAELIVGKDTNPVLESDSFPKIHSVVSLGTSTGPVESKEEDVKVFKYEEAQMEVMSQKHRIVLETMLSPEKLLHVFKCAGRFCSYTTDNAEEALVHTSTHKKIGGENSLRCSYCDFDPMGNAIDLVMHVFKTYNYCSFACSKCFYRASVSQLVYAHIKRQHPGDADKTAVLSTATVAEDKSKDEILSRDEAVMYYVCNNRDPDTGDSCQFKSFVLTKFSEHLTMRHANDTEYPCFMCNIAMPSAKELALHLKTHGLRIYQCCRCLFGAENEADLMAHASAVHPLKQPKAYLRIITSKGPKSEVRVLPLVVLSKTSVQVTVVTPGTAKENPEKEAERSIDLEKLIGHTTSMIESMATTNVTEPSQETPAHIEDSQILESQESCSNALDKEIAESTPNEPPTEQIPVNQAPHVIPKTEPVDTPQNTEKNTASPPDPDVVCLDSDDDSRQIIDLSMDDLPDKTANEEETITVPKSFLYKCSNCSTVNKSSLMFRRHLMICFPRAGAIACAHCSYSATIHTLVEHYEKHLIMPKRIPCTQCVEQFATKPALLKHMKLVHNEPAAKSIPPGASFPNERPERPKRKLSNEAAKTSEPPAKLKKYGPEDVDRLPINPILDELVYCSICEFSTKVRLNMVRHLQLHAEQQPVPRTAPVNPVPHLDTNEKHFDKMVNLASSSITPRNEKSNTTPASMERLSAEAASVYPKFVPARTRYTCGAKYCTYISVNESIFKIHWETLHQGTNDYHCVHCPPHQHLDTSKPLTAVRIMAHLKMHDAKLYACSSCTFYHHTRKVIEKHLKETHAGRVLIVREEGVVPPPAPAPTPPPAAAPTMDLKPWQCGLCPFKSMLRPEVIDHCGRFHQSKMQFKCTYCGFRTSNIENISKHQSKQHVGKKEEVFYFYYREGAIPDEPDGTPRWQKQSQKNPPEIKTEALEPQIPNVVSQLSSTVVKKLAPKPVNLDIVKQEVIEPVEETVDDLCRAFGQFCDPNGLKYKCSLCKIVVDDSREAMQSHLYEELQYRKWGCAICTYKAFHKPGLQSHVQTEHSLKRGEIKEPIELQVDPRIETWVMKFLDYQASIIERNKENLAKQKAEIFRPVPGSSTTKAPEPRVNDTPKDKPNVSMTELERLFGPLGVPNNMNYCCPKCGVLKQTESSMQEHLEMELLWMRWRCNTCNETFRTYHEVQYHCRSAHPTPARPLEAARDPALRAAWLAAVLRVQRLAMNCMPLDAHPPPAPPEPPTPPEPDSLLVVRYEKPVPIPEQQARRRSSSDDEKLVIDEAQPPKPPKPPGVSGRVPEPPQETFPCPRCSGTFKTQRILHNHLLKHYGLKPFTCPYCENFNNHSKQVVAHIKTVHPGKEIVWNPTPIPTEEPKQPAEEPKQPAAEPKEESKSKSSEELKPKLDALTEEVVCLTCEKLMPAYEQRQHHHGTEKVDFGMKGAIVYRCCICCTLHLSVTNFRIHHKLVHPEFSSNYSFYKLHNENRMLACDICNQKFNLLADFRKHKIDAHNIVNMATASKLDPKAVIEIDDDVAEEVSGKRKAEDMPPAKKVAKKSTTKLPSAGIAKKSTTKLPFDNNMEEYSYYGTKSAGDYLTGVTMTLPEMNNVTNFEAVMNMFKKYPVVLIEDIKNKEK